MYFYCIGAVFYTSSSETFSLWKYEMLFYHLVSIATHRLSHRRLKLYEMSCSSRDKRHVNFLSYYTLPWCLYAYNQSNLFLLGKCCFSPHIHLAILYTHIVVEARRQWSAQIETAGNRCKQAGIKMYVKMKKQIYRDC